MTVSKRAGPIDNGLWPRQLSARVVADGPAPRLVGYDVQTDLCRHYSFGEVSYLCLTGELPSPEVGRAFEVCLTFACPVSAGEAPSHAAGLARLMGTNAAGVIAAAAIGLAERAAHILDQHASLLSWLSSSEAGFPESARSTTAEEDEAVRRLALALGPSKLDFPVLAQRPQLMAALLGVLHHLGLDDAAKLETALCQAAWPVVVAEALAVQPFAFFSYPMTLPSFRYQEEARDD